MAWNPESTNNFIYLIDWYNNYKLIYIFFKFRRVPTKDASTITDLKADNLEKLISKVITPFYWQEHTYF